MAFRVPRTILFIATLLVGQICVAAFAQTTPTENEKQVGQSCANGASSADFDALVQCSATSGAGTMQKAPLHLGAVTAPPYANTTCDANKAGMMQWTGTEMQYCNGSAWTAMGGGGGTGLVGEIVAWPTSTVPDGYLWCDGSAVSRTTYANLFAVISTTYGAGDGSTTFNLPNYRGEFLRGRTGATSNDPDSGTRTGGTAVGSTQTSALTTHNHSMDPPSFTTNTQGNHSHTVNNAVISGSGGSNDQSSSAGGRTITALTLANATMGSHTATLDAFTSGSSGTSSNETRPVNTAVMYVIKY